MSIASGSNSGKNCLYYIACQFRNVILEDISEKQFVIRLERPGEKINGSQFSIIDITNTNFLNDQNACFRADLDLKPG